MRLGGARNSLGQIRRNYDLYLLLLPGLAFLALFKFVPIYGLVIAFQDFQIFAGVAGSTRCCATRC
jgi:putative aldouronate transport system permease protein